MLVNPWLLAGLILLAIPSLWKIFVAMQNIGRPHGLTLLGPLERWWPDGTADRTWCILYVPIVRQRWNHSSALLD
jgi:hypothetical protein